MATSIVPSSSTGIEELLDIYIENAESLITQSQQLDVKDAKKLEKKCRSELKYLHSVSQIFFHIDLHTSILSEVKIHVYTCTCLV